MTQYNDKKVVKIEDSVNESHLKGISSCYRELINHLGSLPTERKGLATLAILYNLLRDVLVDGEGLPEHLCTAMVMLDEKLREIGYNSLLDIPSSARDAIMKGALPYFEHVYAELLRRDDVEVDEKKERENVHVSESHHSGRLKYGKVQARYLLYALAELSPKTIKELEKSKYETPETYYRRVLNNLLEKEVIQISHVDKNEKLTLTSRGIKILDEWLERMIEGRIIEQVTENIAQIDNEAAKRLTSKLGEIKQTSSTLSSPKRSMDETTRLSYRVVRENDTDYLVIESEDGKKRLELMLLDVPDPRKGRLVNRFTAQLVFLQVFDEIKREAGQVTWNDVTALINTVPARSIKTKETKKDALFNLVSRGALVENENEEVIIDEVYRELLNKVKEDLFGRKFESVDEIESLGFGVVERWIDGVGEIKVPAPSIFAKLVKNYKEAYLSAYRQATTANS